jgi:hypothetical protein
MRDQDMADVDVTSMGVWERASDALFEELKQRELEDEANGVVVDNPSRSRIKGGRLTEQNVKLWLSVVRIPVILLLPQPDRLPLESKRAYISTANIAHVHQIPTEAFGS